MSHKTDNLVPAQANLLLCPALSTSVFV